MLMLDTNDVLDELNEFEELFPEPLHDDDDGENSVEDFCNSWDAYDLGAEFPSGGSEISAPSPRAESPASPGAPECAICLQAMVDAAALAECAHVFCESCLVSWAEKCTSCPLCRVPFSAFTSRATGEVTRVKPKSLDAEVPSDASSSEESVVERRRRRPRAAAAAPLGRCPVCRQRMNGRLALECEICFRKFHSRCLSVRMSTCLGCPVCFSCGMDLESAS